METCCGPCVTQDAFNREDMATCGGPSVTQGASNIEGMVTNVIAQVLHRIRLI